MARLDGNQLYMVRARAALPILVSLARAGRKVTYSELADRLSMPNPRNLDHVLGAIGDALLELSTRWGICLPRIQALVVGRSTDVPGDGLAWYAPDADTYRSASRDERKKIVLPMQEEAFGFEGWDDVLDAFGLKPLSADLHVR